MYAVEKLGSYITRGVYTVSGPFHPFGGAVDIIVVQQQDGSFKSSPWYVRFGKFQGVLKTKEKIVNISVNGVEAGFNMYLDHKGEAFFLRESDGAEGDFVLSPPTSGDETDAESRHGRLNKVQSLSIEGGKREELVTQADEPNAKIVARTSSRRSRILGFMFGRRSGKDNAKIGNMDRVSSLERAEIAADLLEMKWSTNLTSDDLKSDTLQVKPSENCESNMPACDKEQTRSVSDSFSHEEMVNFHGEGIGDKLRRGTLSNNHSEEVSDYGSPCLSVQEEVDQICKSEIGNLANSSRSISDHETLECIFNNHNKDSQICSSNFVNAYDDSLDSHGEQLGDCRKHTSTEKCFEEITSHEEVVEIFTLEEGLVIDRNETVSEMLTLEPVEIDTQAKSLEEIADVSVSGRGANEFEYFSYSGSTESSVVTVDSGIKASRHVDLPSNGLGYCSYPVSESGAPLVQEDSNSFHCMNNSEILSGKRETISELVPVSEYDTQLGKENPISFAGMETVKYVCSVISVNSQCDNLMNGSCEDPTIDSSIQLCPSVTSEKQFNITSYSPTEELVISETKTISSNIMTEESVMEKEQSTEVIDYFGNPFQIEETLDLASFSTSASSKLVNSVDAADSAISPAFGSFNSRCEVIELQNHVEADTTVISSSLNASGQESVAISQSREPEDPEDPLKCLEDIQFPPSDTESCGAKENDCDVSNSELLAELDDACDLHTGAEIKDNGLKDLDYKQSMEGASEVSRFHSDPINIPGCRTVSDGNQPSAMSLPIIRSYTSDLEGSTLFHPLSCSLDVKSDIYELDVLEKEHSSSSDPKLVSENNKKQVEVAAEVADTPLAAKILGEQNAIPINADVELSLCKHLLSEGMGTEAARQAFDAEKEQIFEARVMIPMEGTSRATTQPGGSWRLWPFGMKRSRTISTVQTSSGSAVKTEADPIAKPRDLNGEINDMPRTNDVKKFRSLTPTSEELASLDLKEGANVVTFNFSTPMLGPQKVDARIYLWKWNSRIVISDVDGTITKSDVLGQFMPLVGRDWSQTGVAHLFSAIKENGYQLLFLSARAISQAHLTRQFLCNLKQNGKALPDGPVVISPDGLFPSLYREVIRRAPHEFKISCLEAIKEIFPPDRNPFYAGFGNRDTDEISYLKVGIPLGKIFIINPKGQVAVNRRVDTKSYTSLHELVNAMFPTATSDEQEDYNSWNYWKLPHTKIDI